MLAHGMGDSREAYRFVAPALVAAGYRVAAMDLRGCGESSAGWASYARTDIAGDLIALLNHLGGPAVLVGHSISGGAATIAAHGFQWSADVDESYEWLIALVDRGLRCTSSGSLGRG